LNSVLVLACAQALTATGLTVLVLLGGIVATELAPRESLSTLPISFAVIAVALGTIPAVLLMRRFGRRAGFIAGAGIGAVAALLTAFAILHASFLLFCVGAVLFGAGTAFSQQYRFAAAECVPPEQVSRAVSRILLGSLGAAVIGPPVALLARHWLPVEYAGSFIGVALLYVLAIGVLALLRLPPSRAPTTQGRARSVAELMAEPSFRIAVLAGVVAFGVMSFVMTAAPLSMHVHHHHSVEATAWVIQSHVLAMRSSMESVPLISSFAGCCEAALAVAVQLVAPFIPIRSSMRSGRVAVP
jgi:MFS family permease